MNRKPLMLASDLDGTLIPTDVDDARAEEIRTFRDVMGSRGLTLAYVTGRGRDLALKGIQRVGLPLPDVLVCDVGTSVWVRRDGHDAWFVDEAYQQRMREALGGIARADIVGSIGALEGLELQEPPKQTDFKISYYVAPERLDALRDNVGERLAGFPVPPKAIWSHDPYSGRMLLDVLPRNVAKHVALGHLREQHGHALDEIVYAGDSGNDFDALLSGHPAIVVANAPEVLKEQIRQEARAAGTLDRVYFAERPFAGGVIEGLRHFGAL
jgi:HAD superfamily hydrolase (TIGR01484 family)